MFNGEYKTLIAGIQVYSKSASKPKYQQALDLAAQLMELQSSIKAYEKNEADIPGCIGRCYQGPDTDWDHVMSSLETLNGFFDEDNLSFGLISKMSQDSFNEHQHSFKTESEQLSSEAAYIEEAKSRVAAQFSVELLDPDKNSYDYCIRKIGGCLTDFDRLANWINFMDLLKRIDNADLSGFIDLVIENDIVPNHITGSYRKDFYKQWIENIIFSVPELSSFSRIKQDQAVQNFAEKDGLQYEISKIQIKSELSQKRPDLSMVAGGSAVSILRKEGNKSRKQMPIRKLLSETGSLVQITAQKMHVIVIV